MITNPNYDRSSKRRCIVAILTIMMIFAGCNGFTDINPPQSSNNSSSTPITTPNTATPTETRNSTPTPTDTPTPEYSTKEKYSSFRDGYVEAMEESGVNVVNNSIDVDDKTLFVTYEMRDPDSDKYTGRERENISLGYVVGVEYYLDKNQSGVDETWVPKQVNVTVVTPEGELYETAYTTFERAKKMIDGEISARRYLLEYYGTIEPGPANPDYEG